MNHKTASFLLCTPLSEAILSLFKKIEDRKEIACWNFCYKRRFLQLSPQKVAINYSNLVAAKLKTENSDKPMHPQSDQSLLSACFVPGKTDETVQIGRPFSVFG